MEPTKEILDKYSRTRLQALARSKQLSPAGTKDQLIEKILGKKSSKKEEKKSKTAVKNKPKTQSRKEKEHFPLNELPVDIQGTAALNLSYEDVLSLCGTNKKLANICKDPEFWRKKILKDFKGQVDHQDLENLIPKKSPVNENENQRREAEEKYRKQLTEIYRAKYEDLYADKLDQESRQYFYNKYREDKEWNNYNKEWDKIGKQIEDLQERIKELKENKTKLT